MKTTKKLEELFNDHGYISMLYMNSLYNINVDFIYNEKVCRIEYSHYNLKNAIDRLYKDKIKMKNG